VIQLDAVDAAGPRVVARPVKPDQFLARCAQLPPGCLMVKVVCSSAHHRAGKHRVFGLDTRLIAANCVDPSRTEGQGGKDDTTDAPAI